MKPLKSGIEEEFSGNSRRLFIEWKVIDSDFCWLSIEKKTLFLLYENQRI